MTDPTEKSGMRDIGAEFDSCPMCDCCLDASSHHVVYSHGIDMIEVRCPHCTSKFLPASEAARFDSLRVLQLRAALLEAREALDIGDAGMDLGVVCGVKDLLPPTYQELRANRKAVRDAIAKIDAVLEGKA